MAEGTQKRIQPDLIEEIKQHEGGSFSEKMRAWRLAEVEATLQSVKNLTGSDKPLTIEDLENALEERLEGIANVNEAVNDSSTEVDYAYIESKIEEHADRIIEELGKGY